MSQPEKTAPTGMSVRIMGPNREEVNNLASLFLSVIGKNRAWRGPTLKNRYDEGWRCYLNFAPEGGGSNGRETG